MEIVESSSLVSNKKNSSQNFVDIENSTDRNLHYSAEVEPVAHDLAWYVSDIKQLLTSSAEVEGEPSDDTRLQYAIRRYRKACELFPDSYDLKFIGHKIAIKEGDMSQAIMYFDELRRLFPDHEPLKEYLMEITESVRHQTTDDNFSENLPFDPTHVDELDGTASIGTPGGLIFLDSKHRTDAH
ncbi:6917_t:CDS:2 [Acaulospora morrowiae]|uniref:6917_t:CDS:1 n=1 Tax=Acaulospora morrowiae TaxID=94023 RepID=A0A9N9DGJ8_9GLOM|nr:6917_t:CDS:2 [Acaulospora morrowiae]